MISFWLRHFPSGCPPVCQVDGGIPLSRSRGRSARAYHSSPATCFLHGDHDPDVMISLLVAAESDRIFSLIGRPFLVGNLRQDQTRCVDRETPVSVRGAVVWMNSAAEHGLPHACGGLFAWEESEDPAVNEPLCSYPALGLCRRRYWAVANLAGEEHWFRPSHPAVSVEAICICQYPGLISIGG